jgi:hypothetical protein
MDEVNRNVCVSFFALPAPSLDTAADLSVRGYVEPASGHIVDDREPIYASVLMPGGRPCMRVSLTEPPSLR